MVSKTIVIALLSSNCIAFLCGIQIGRLATVTVNDFVSTDSPTTNYTSYQYCKERNVIFGKATQTTENNDKITEEDFCKTSAIINEQQKWNSKKKVIAYSLFANDEEVLKPWLLEGLKHNVEGAALYYPDWIIRVYMLGDDNLLREIVGASSGTAEVVRCHESSPLTLNNSRKRIIRFLAYDDPKVEMMISRDLDSRFSPREMFAVHQWQSSNYSFHVMRDHDRHTEYVMAGMFGIKRGALAVATGTSMSFLIHQACQDYPSSEIPTSIVPYTGDDQVFLGKYIWPVLKSSTMAHDINSKRCKSLSKGKSYCTEWPVGGPTSIKHNFFVGAPFKKTNTSQYHCNVRCRDEPF